MTLVSHLIRRLVRRPRWFAINALALSMGIAALLAVISLSTALNGPLPWKNAKNVFRISTATNLVWTGVAPAVYSVIHSSLRGKVAMGAWVGMTSTLKGGAFPQTIHVAVASPSLLRTLGARVRIGGLPVCRDLSDLLISDTLWRKQFAAAPNVIGRPVFLDQRLYHVAGVLASGQDYPPHMDAWLCLKAFPALLRIRTLPLFGVLVRPLRPISPDKLRQEIDTAIYSSHNKSRVFLQSMQLVMRGDALRRMRALMQLAILLLVIAWGSAALISLMEGLRRQEEVAICIALGLSPKRLLMEFILEGFILGIVSCLFGTCFILLISHFYNTAVNRNYGITPHILGWNILWSDILLALCAGILTSLINLLALPPRLRTHIDLQSYMGDWRSARRGKIWQVIIACETAAVVVLLAGAAILVQKFQKATQTNLGFSPLGVTSISIDSSSLPTPHARALIAAIRSSSNAKAIAVCTSQPFANVRNYATVKILGHLSSIPDVMVNAVSPGYFNLLRIPLLKGRKFSNDDIQRRAKLCIVNQAFSQHYFHGKTALDAQLRIADGSACTVVGVVGNTISGSIDKPPAPTIFMLFSQSPSARYQILVRFAYRVRPQTLQQKIWHLSSALPLSRIYSLGDEFKHKLITRKQPAELAALFSLTCLLLALLTLYYVITYWAHRKRKELAIRIALGAGPRNIVLYTLSSSFRSLLIGGIIGGVLSGILSRGMSNLSPGPIASNPYDPAIFATMIVLGTGLVVSWIAANRACAIRPTDFLITE